MSIVKEKFGCSGKPAARRGPKPVKMAISEEFRKNRKNRLKIRWNQKKDVLGHSPNDFFCHQGARGVWPPLRKSILFTVGNIKLKINKYILRFCLDLIYGLLGP